MAKKRTRLEVIKDILEVIRARNGKIKPTHVLYKSNLSYQMMEEYLKDLKDKELIREHRLATGKTYSLTDKGFAFLNEYHKIQAFASSFGFE